MGGSSNGYSNGGMQQGYGGYSSGGYGGGYGQQSGYGNGGYQPGMNGQYGGMQGGFGQQPMSQAEYVQSHAGQPIQSSDYGNYVQGFNQSQNQQPFTGRGGGTYTPGMSLFGNGGGQQYGFQPWGQSMFSGNQWPQFGGMQYGGQRGFPGMGARQGGPQTNGGYQGGSMPGYGAVGIGQDAPYQPPSTWQSGTSLGAMTGGNMGAGNMPGQGVQTLAPPGSQQFDQTPGYVPPFNPNLIGQVG